jgi:prepilin-type N-terminal cleavage/methylation domain-containing protein
MRTSRARTPNRPAPSRTFIGARAFTLIELIVVVSLLAMFVSLVQMNLFAGLRKSRFSGRVQEFVSVMQMAASGAAEGGGRYEVIVDLASQSYLLRRISGTNLSDVLDEEIITQGRFGEHCHASYVEFDDGDYTNDAPAKFRVSQAGWHYGGKIVFLDDAEQPHTVVVTRLNPIVDFVDGDSALLKPKAKEEMSFR